MIHSPWGQVVRHLSHDPVVTLPLCAATACTPHCAACAPPLCWGRRSMWPRRANDRTAAVNAPHASVGAVAFGAVAVGKQASASETHEVGIWLRVPVRAAAIGLYTLQPRSQSSEDGFTPASRSNLPGRILMCISRAHRSTLRLATIRHLHDAPNPMRRDGAHLVHGHTRQGARVPATP